MRSKPAEPEPDIVQAVLALIAGCIAAWWTGFALWDHDWPVAAVAGAVTLFCAWAFVDSV